MDELTFDRLAEQTLTTLLTSLDPLDGVEAELSQGVLTLSFDEGPPFIINSHRAAGQIWMAADRTAWHFEPVDAGQRWLATRPPHEELHDALSTVLARRLGHPVTLRPAREPADAPGPRHG